MFLMKMNNIMIILMVLLLSCNTKHHQIISDTEINGMVSEFTKYEMEEANTLLKIRKLSKSYETTDVFVLADKRLEHLKNSAYFSKGSYDNNPSIKDTTLKCIDSLIKLIENDK